MTPRALVPGKRIEKEARGSLWIIDMPTIAITAIAIPMSSRSLIAIVVDVRGPGAVSVSDLRKNDAQNASGVLILFGVAVYSFPQSGNSIAVAALFTFLKGEWHVFI